MLDCHGSLVTILNLAFVRLWPLLFLSNRSDHLLKILFRCPVATDLTQFTSCIFAGAFSGKLPVSLLLIGQEFLLYAKFRYILRTWINRVTFGNGAARGLRKSIAHVVAHTVLSIERFLIIVDTRWCPVALVWGIFVESWVLHTSWDTRLASTLSNEAMRNALLGPVVILLQHVRLLGDAREVTIIHLILNSLL